MIVEFIFHGTRGGVKLALRKKLQTLVFKNFLSNSQWKTSQQAPRELDSAEVGLSLLKPGRVKARKQIVTVALPCDFQKRTCSCDP